MVWMEKVDVIVNLSKALVSCTGIGSTFLWCDVCGTKNNIMLLIERFYVSSLSLLGQIMIKWTFLSNIKKYPLHKNLYSGIYRFSSVLDDTYVLMYQINSLDLTSSRTFPSSSNVVNVSHNYSNWIDYEINCYQHSIQKVELASYQKSIVAVLHEEKLSKK